MQCMLLLVPVLQSSLASMFEGLLESVLLQRLHLDRYIDGLDRAKLKVDIW